MRRVRVLSGHERPRQWPAHVTSAYEAVWRKDTDLEQSAEAAMAKSWAPRLTVNVIHQCLLTLGHVGYSTEHNVGQRLHVISLEIGDGTAQFSKLVLSRNLLGHSYAP